MLDRGWLQRHHPLSYGSLAIVFALPTVSALLLAWPEVTAVPDVLPGIWGPLVMYSTLLSAGLALRAVTPATVLDPDDGRFG